VLLYSPPLLKKADSKANKLRQSNKFALNIKKCYN
jgi:hypothetical protein